jgi:hypothetical protein
MNKYRELKKKHQEEVNKFPFMFAFDKKQFAEGMKKLGLNENDTDKIYDIGYGRYIRKTDSDKLDEMYSRHDKELKKAIEDDLTGEGFIYDMFNYELSNHEYCVTYDVGDTLNALGFSIDDINNDKRLLHGLQLATKNQHEQHEMYL